MSVKYGPGGSCPICHASKTKCMCNENSIKRKLEGFSEQVKEIKSNMKPYITIESTDRSSLSDMVCEQIALGYVPLGGIAITSAVISDIFPGSYELFYVQALWKPSVKLLND